jgi:hypothetical protein
MILHRHREAAVIHIGCEPRHDVGDEGLLAFVWQCKELPGDGAPLIQPATNRAGTG